MTQYPFSSRMQGVSGSAVRALLKVAGQADMVSFSGGMPASELFDVDGIRMALSDTLTSIPARALQYGVTEGVPLLQEVLADRMRRRGASVQPDDVLVTTGSQQAITLLGEVMLDPGDVVVLERPTYLSAISVFRLRGATFRELPGDASGLDVDALDEALKPGDVKFVYLVPTFANPSGVTLSLERRLRLLDLAVKYGVLIVEDDPYSELWFDRPGPPRLIDLAEQVPGAADYVVYLSSLSKTLAPGLRLGWVVAPPGVLEKMTVVKQGVDAHTSTLLQHAAARYLATDALEQHLDMVRSVYRERQQAMTNAIEKFMPRALSYTPSGGGIFLWARLADGGDASALAHAALQRGVAFVPGVQFYAGSPEVDTLRLCFAATPPDRIELGVTRIAQAVGGLRPARQPG